MGAAIERHVCSGLCLIMKVDKLEERAPWDVVLSSHYLSLSTSVGLNRHNKSTEVVRKTHQQPNETRETLKELIKDLIRKRWNATRLLEEGERITRQREIRKIWADKKFADFGPKSGPTFDLS